MLFGVQTQSSGFEVHIDLAHQKAMHPCKVQSLGAALDVESSKEAPQVHLHGVLADVELQRNVSIGQTPVEHQNELLLALAELGLAARSGWEFFFVFFSAFFFVKESTNGCRDVTGLGGFFDVEISTCLQTSLLGFT